MSVNPACSQLVLCAAGVVRTPQALTTASPVKPVGPSSRQVVVAAAGGSPSKAAAGSGVFKDASSEIADIDQRLHALQNFLKMAKSSVGAA